MNPLIDTNLSSGTSDSSSPMPADLPSGCREDALRRARVLLADDNPAILQHASRLLADEFDVVGAVLDGESVLRHCLHVKPDVVVLDISMGGLSGLDVARRMVELGHQAKIVFLTVHEEQDFVCAAFAAGGTAYVVKSHLNADLPNAIRAALDGKVFISAPLQRVSLTRGT